MLLNLRVDGTMLADKVLGIREKFKMKTITLTALAASCFVTASFAGQIGSGGVSSIKSNGNIAGNPSYSIRCNSGSGVVIRKSNKWTDSSGYTYSDRLWDLSLEALAKKMCE
jgi:hypothetical protein